MPSPPYNPYEPPESQGLLSSEDVQQKVVFEFKRPLLIAAEVECPRFSIDPSALSQANDAKLLLLDKLEAVLQQPHGIMDCRYLQIAGNHVVYSRTVDGSDQTGFVLVAYAECDSASKELVIWDWEPRVSDPKRKGCPLNWSRVIGEMLWPQ